MQPDYHLDRRTKRARMGSEDRPWYEHPVYAAYWRHYHACQFWLQKHRRAARKALHCLSHTHPAVPGLARPRNWGHGTWAENPWSSSWVKPPSNSFAETDQQSDDEQEAYEEDEEGEEETELSVEFEIDMTEMEITEDLRKYFAKTERHRREREQQQQEEAKLHDLLADHATGTARATCQAPMEHPGERRRAEMELLYGASATSIMAMETSLQLSFDRMCDLHQPKFWPVIALRL